MNASSIIPLLIRELDGFRRELKLFPDEESLWRVVPGITNSAANLAIHVAGNLQHYVGAVLGGTKYIRRRDVEFSRRSGTLAEILSELDRAEDVVRTVLPKISEAMLDSEYPEAVGPMKFRTDQLLLHLCVHAGFHLGQAGYLRRAMTGSATSSGPLPLQPIAIAVTS
jgi:uncharacterized damage-inducible protein DinB